MNAVQVRWNYQDESEEFHEHEQVTTRFQEACDIIDNYPWAREVALFKKTEAGGGIHFYVSDGKKHAEYTIIPTTKHEGLLLLDIFIKQPFLYFFGGEKVSKDFGEVTIAICKQQIKEMCDYSIDELYQKYKKD